MNYLKHKVRPTILAYLSKYLVRSILWTCRVEVKGIENLEQASTGPCILTLWHNRLSIMADILYYYAPPLTYAAFISKSRDGEILAKLACSYPNGQTIRVAHSSRGQALKSLIDRIKQAQWVAIVTPDGPRGPRYEVKPGVLLAAEQAGAQIIPVSWCATRYWQLKSWDKLIIPKPFSKVLCTFGAPATHENIQTAMLALDETVLNSILMDSSKYPR